HPDADDSFIRSTRARLHLTKPHGFKAFRTGSTSARILTSNLPGKSSERGSETQFRLFSDTQRDSARFPAPDAPAALAVGAGLSRPSGEAGPCRHRSCKRHAKRQLITVALGRLSARLLESQVLERRLSPQVEHLCLACVCFPRYSDVGGTGTSTD